VARTNVPVTFTDDLEQADYVARLERVSLRVVERTSAKVIFLYSCLKTVPDTRCGRLFGSALEDCARELAPAGAGNADGASIEVM
jgi:hypothetical protein